jgi:hypothetical protein
MNTILKQRVLTFTVARHGETAVTANAYCVMETNGFEDSGPCTLR